jgi:7,8-dihydropterin-6-yl-methyl-4-(beta-D-ribofuranosyl)aminobenzene 5'-phosphate synthase
VDDYVPSGSPLAAEHGASFLIETKGYHVLFDTGQSGPVLLSNLAALGYAPGQIDALVISHAHDDHTGGLPGFLNEVQGIPFYAHPDHFRERFRKTDTGPEKVGPSMDHGSLAERVTLCLSTEPVAIVPGVWTTGEITARLEPDGRSRYHVVRQGDSWVPDPYRDDLSVLLETDNGLVLICGCCHAGLLNTLAHVRGVFGQDPVAVVGGIHLFHADAPTIDHIIDELQRYGPPRLWVGHCTGQRAFKTLKAAFGELVSPCQTGTILDFAEHGS